MTNRSGIFDYVTFEDLAKFFPEQYVGSSQKERFDDIKLNRLDILNSPDDYLALEDACICPIGIIWRNYWIYDAIEYAPANWHAAHWITSFFDNETKQAHISLPHDIPSVEMDTVFVDTFNGRKGFGDLTHDSLPYVHVFERIRERHQSAVPIFRKPKYRNSIKLLKAAFQAPLVFWSLAGEAARLPSVEDGDIDLVAPAVMCKKLYLPRRQTVMNTPAHEGWHLSFAGLRKARQRIQDYFGLQAEFSTCRKKVYLHRHVNWKDPSGPLQGRDYSNVDALCVEMLNGQFFGFEPGLFPLEIVAPEIFSASSIVALHGAGLCNFIFAQPDCHIFEIRSGFGNWRSIEAMCAVLGNRFVAVVQRKPEEGEKPQLDVEGLLAAIDAANKSE